MSMGSMLSRSHNLRYLNVTSQTHAVFLSSLMTLAISAQVDLVAIARTKSTSLRSHIVRPVSTKRHTDLTGSGKVASTTGALAENDLLLPEAGALNNIFVALTDLDLGGAEHVEQQCLVVVQTY